MKNRIIIGAIFFFLVNFISQSQNADSLFLEQVRSKNKYRIGGVKITGAENTDKNVVALLSGLVEGDDITIPGDKIHDAIKKLWKQGMFENIEILSEKIIGKDIFLEIHVTERPRLTKFNFKGDVRKGEADDIRNKIRLMKERVVTDYLVGTIKNTVHDFYTEKGFYFNRVEISQKLDSSQRSPHVVLTINVKKGRKIRIQDVNILGNTNLKKNTNQPKTFKLI